MSEYVDRFLSERKKNAKLNSNNLFKMHLLLFTTTGAVDRSFLSKAVPGLSAHVCLCLQQNTSNKLCVCGGSGGGVGVGWVEFRQNRTKFQRTGRRMAFSDFFVLFCIPFETLHFSISFVAKSQWPLACLWAAHLLSPNDPYLLIKNF